MKYIALYNTQLKKVVIKVFIIGEGSMKKEVNQFIVQNNINAELVGRIENQNLDQFILSNIDLAFGMGMSALEFAKLGIPTVFTMGMHILNNDASLENNYNWIFNSVDYNVTSDPSLNKHLSYIDFNTINNHKIHGPKGVGELFIKENTKIIPLFHGGGHEFKTRSGTENISGIVGFAKAAEIGIQKINENIQHMNKLRDYMIKELLKIMQKE